MVLFNRYFSAVLGILLTSMLFAAGGDMGLATDPLADGSADHPYLIEDLADFDTFADPCNADFYWVESVYTQLTCDIDLAGRVYDNAVIATYNSDYVSYKGFFDGRGHLVLNLEINTEGRCRDYLGLFGDVGSPGEVRDIGVHFFRIDGGHYSYLVGGLCGMNNGTVENCYAIGDSIGSCRVGGLCGLNGGTISNCYAQSHITGVSNSLGGLCGESSGTVTNCYAVGTITGGTDSRFIGGLFGGSPFYGQTTNCFWNYQTSQITVSDGGMGLTTAQLQDAKVFALNGWGENPAWRIDDGNDYPRLAWENSPGTVIPEPPVIDWFPGSGTEEDPYQIDSAEALNQIGTASILWDKYFLLTDDIDLTDVDFNPIGLCWGSEFTGDFDGNSHIIRNLTIDRGDSISYCLGIFGCIGEEGIVHHLGVEDLFISCGVDSSWIGGLCGVNFGEMMECHTSGSITGGACFSDVGGLAGVHYEGRIRNCYADVSVDGGYHSSNLGGLIGWNYHDSSVISCFAMGDITAGETSRSIGGFCGESSGRNDILNCFAKGAIIVGDDSHECAGLCGANLYHCNVKNCYAVGSVTGGENCENLGGLCGLNDEGTVENSFWDTETSGVDFSDGGEGKTADEMKMQSTFTDAGWGFGYDNDEADWFLPNDDYPRLAWERTDNSGLYELIIDTDSNGIVFPDDGFYLYGSIVYIVAMPDNDFRIKAWHGTDNDDSTSWMNTVTMNSDKTVTVEFKEFPFYDMNLTSVNVRAGKIRNVSSDTLSIKADSFNVTQEKLGNNIDFLVYCSYDEDPIYSETIEIPGFKNERCTVRQGNSIFKFDLKNDIFQFTGRKMDLTGLHAPIRVVLVNDYCEISGIAYDGDAMGSGGEVDVINGRNDIPVALMSGIEDSLAVDKAVFRSGKRAGTDSLTIQGTMTLEDPAGFGQGDINIHWGGYSVQLSAEQLLPIGKRNAYRFKKTKDYNGSVASALFDLDKCTYKITLRNADIPVQSNPVDFNIAFGEFDQQISVSY